MPSCPRLISQAPPRSGCPRTGGAERGLCSWGKKRLSHLGALWKLFRRRWSFSRTLKGRV
jgi:hypothetical protein